VQRTGDRRPHGVGFLAALQPQSSRAVLNTRFAEFRRLIRPAECDVHDLYDIKYRSLRGTIHVGSLECAISVNEWRSSAKCDIYDLDNVLNIHRSVAYWIGVA
jgi:hypothetical protein